MHLQNLNQNSLLVKRQNDNTSSLLDALDFLVKDCQFGVSPVNYSDSDKGHIGKLNQVTNW